jgi:ribosomal protein RSM22 (predicted rRNA methylase)
MTPPVQIALLLEGVSRKTLSDRAARLSAAYRGGGTSVSVADRLDGLAYLVARAPATYAAIRAALARAQEAAPGFSPLSLLDIGAGPGTAAWAARDLWPGMDTTTLVEPNPVFRELAAELLPEARIIPGRLSAGLPEADLVTAGYVLAELAEAGAARAARELWAATRGMLVLVEPGTPSGFARIRAARAALIEAGGQVAAPCAHDEDCPATGSNWCHFFQRLPRSRDHRIAKSAQVPFEDEAYAYVAVSRLPPPHRVGARIVGPVTESKAGIAFPLCDESGLRTLFVARRDKDAFRAVRRKNWGDAF